MRQICTYDMSQISQGKPNNCSSHVSTLPALKEKKRSKNVHLASDLFKDFSILRFIFMLGNYEAGRQTLLNNISSAYKQLLDSASKTIMPDVRIFNSGFSIITKLTVAFIQMNGMYRNKSWYRCLVAKRTFSRAWLRLEFLTCSCNGVVEEEKNPVTPTSSILRQVVYKHSGLPKCRFVCFVHGVKHGFVTYQSESDNWQEGLQGVFLTED